VPRFVDETLRIMVDPYYPPSAEYQKIQKKQDKVYDLIYAEGEITNMDYVQDGNTTINKRQPML